MEPLDREVDVPSDSRWFAVFKANRRILPEGLSRIPNLILIDFLPIRLRNRLDQLLEWCESICPGVPVVVIAPDGDMEFTRKLAERRAIVCHLGSADHSELSSVTGRQQAQRGSSLTAAWGIRASGSEVPLFHIHKIVGIESIEDEFNNILKLVSSTEHEKWGIPTVFRKIQTMAWVLRDLMSPIRHYELLVHEGISLRAKITSLKNAVPINDWERRVFDSTLPLAVQKLLYMYDSLKEFSIPPKAHVLIKLLQDLLINKRDKIVVVVPAGTTVSTIAAWLDTELGDNSRAKVQVFSIKDYVLRRQVILIDESSPSDLIFANAIPKRHSSVLFAELAPTVHFVTFPKEATIAKISLQQAYYNKNRWRRSWLQTIFRLYALQYEDDGGKLLNIPITEHSYIAGVKQQTFDSSIPLINPETLNTDALMGFWEKYSSIDEEDDRFATEALNLPSQYSVMNKSNAICVAFQGGHRIFLVPDKEQQFFSHLGDEMMSGLPSSIQRRDILVSINANTKRDLFNEVVQGTGLTPMMIALQGYLDQWRKIVSTLISKHADANDPYVSALRDVKAHGGTIKSSQTIRNWVDGNTEYLQKKDNVFAVCRAANVDEPGKVSDLIYGAMQELWNFRRALGRKLNSLIRHQVARLVDSRHEGTPINDVIQAPGGVRIPLADIADALEVYEVESVDPDDLWLVPTDLLGWIISFDEWSHIRHIVRRQED